ncbi:MAG TPA: ABC transporter permease [Dehalococcoidia bacterium]|jgi:peptide/nickel transport system permease protein|nr:ABC transporter permease [Dehalococcoidia bacterium]
MRQYIIKRLGLAAVTLFGVSLIVFFMLRVLPGDLVQQVAGENTVTPEVRARIERQLGLDQPAYEQYFRWLGGVLHLDFGRSLRDQSSISARLQRTLPTTIEMALLALLVSMLIALPVGIISAIRQDSIVDYIGRSVSIGFLAIPTFWLGTMIIVFASLWFTKATPVPQDYRQIWENPVANLKFMLFPFGYFVPVGPAVVLGVSLSGTVMRLTRAQMLEVLRQDYIRTAAAKGLRESGIVVGHAVKNAMIPVITVVGLQVPILVGGSVIVESIYNVPGMGQWFYQAIGFRDYTAVQSIALLTGVAVVLSNLIVDLTYAYLDPRIRYG